MPTGKQVLGGTATVVAAVGIFFGGRYLYRQFTKPPIAKGKLPQGGAGLPVVGYTEGGKPVFWTPQGVASELFRAMDGWTASETKETAWQDFLDLPTDDMKVAVYNYYNAMPENTNKKTLTQEVDSALWYSWGASKKQDMLDDLKRLRLV